MIRQIFLIILLLAFSYGCKRATLKNAEWYQGNGKLKVLTTIAMIGDLVQRIGGDDIDTISLIRGELDPHAYELVKGDDEKFARADLIFYNGLGLEHGLSLRQNLEGNPKAIAVADALLRKDPSLILSVDGQYDPHIWMDIALWMNVIDPITQALCEKDPEHASLYCQRGKELKKEMALADQKAYALLQVIPQEKRYLVTSHDALSYFTRHYLAAPGEKNWQTRCRAPEGLAPEAQMNMNDIMTILFHVERFGISILFPESNVNKDALYKIVHACKEKGLTIQLCQESLYGDTMGEAGSYLEMIAHNVEVVARGLAPLSHKYSPSAKQSIVVDRVDCSEEKNRVLGG